MAKNGTNHQSYPLIDPKYLRFFLTVKLMGEGYKKYKTGTKSLNILSTSWKCSKESELASLEAWIVVQTIWYLGIQLFDASNKEDDF